MIHKIVRENGTEIPNIKSCVYKRDINGDTNLRAGRVSSACIEVTVYGKKTEAPDPGEKLLFYQLSDSGSWRFLGTFYAEPAITSRMTYKFVAYDKVARLDVDFSARLWELQNAFPMPLYSLVSYAATEAGVTLHSSASSALSGIAVKQFYADNITCRQIFSWAAELAGKYVVARTDNEQMTFIWYSEQANTRVYPTSTNLPIVVRNPIDINSPAMVVYTNVIASNVTTYQWQYRTAPNRAWRNASGSGYDTMRFNINLRESIDGYQYRCVLTNANGTTYTDIITVHVDPDGTYVEPTDSPLHYDTEATVAYRQNGLQYENYTVAPVDCVAVFSVDDDNTSVMYPSSTAGDNIYSVYNNLLLTDAEVATLNTVAQNIYTALHAVPEYRPATIKLFPSENQILPGRIIAVTDAQGFSFATIVMSIVSDGAVDKLKSTGAETYEETDQVNQKSKIVNMASSILRLKKLIVEEIEAIIARIDTLFANEITVTGSLHSDDYDKLESQPFAASGMSLDFAERTINGKYFTVDENGTLISRSAFFGDMYFSDAYNSADTTKNEAPYQMLDAQGNVSTNYTTYSAITIRSYDYESLYPRLFTGYNGYKVGEKCTFIYRVPIMDEGGVRYFVRYLMLSALSPTNSVPTIKPVVRVKKGQETIGEIELEYGTAREAGSSGILTKYEFSSFYLPSYSGVVLPGTYVQVEVDLPENVCISLSVVRGFYSTWYGYNNNHTYGGTGTYVGTDGISADKMQVNGNDVWSKGDFTLPLPIEQGGTGATEATAALTNLHGVLLKTISPGITSSNPATLSFSGSFRFVLILMGNNASTHGVVTVYGASATQTPSAVPVGNLGSAISLTPRAGSLTVSTTTGTVGCYIVCLNQDTYDRITVTRN